MAYCKRQAENRFRGSDFFAGPQNLGVYAQTKEIAVHYSIVSCQRIFWSPWRLLILSHTTAPPAPAVFPDLGDVGIRFPPLLLKGGSVRDFPSIPFRSRLWLLHLRLNL
jgi:hypothetical protein